MRALKFKVLPSSSDVAHDLLEARTFDESDSRQVCCLDYALPLRSSHDELPEVDAQAALPMRAGMSSI
jgi:hypothetical protein